MNNEWNSEVVTEESNVDITVDQSYNASSENPQSGTAVAGAIEGVNQLPASTSADATKVLTVNSEGVPGWATAASGGATWTYAEATTGAYVSSDERKIYIPLTSSFPEKIGANLYYLYFRAPLKEPPSEDDNYIIEVNVGAAYGNAVLYLSSAATEVYGRIVIAGYMNSAPPTTPYYLILNAGYRLKFTVTGTISGNVYMLN